MREARANFSQLLGSVYHTGEPVAVERNGRLVAYVVSPMEFERARDPAAALERLRAVRGSAGKLPRPLPWKAMLRIAKDEALSKHKP